ncbi:response regulator transcription factor [Vallitalea okinawensis]|uniref:response regulator transcription factor n=1 Tax=Vallitalea okinawensis TaxID=2078660 RepID=UPI000CFC6912|nr:response regulator [Vallitalea okinawensis]
MNIRVLIVEDEPPIQRSLKKLIENINPSFKVADTAFNGDEAIEKLKHSDFHVVFTDIRMPVKDGFHVLNYINNHNLEIIPIILTGFEEFEYARQAIQLNVLDYLLKPVDVDSLTKLLDQIHNQLSIKFECHDSDSYKTSSTAIMHQIQHYLEDHIKEPITQQSLAKRFGFTPAYLSRLFKKEVGMSPTEYLCTLRITRAKELMQQNPHILTKSLAPAVGFTDPFYFSKTFKKITGLSPKTYKEEMKK